MLSIIGIQLIQTNYLRIDQNSIVMSNTQMTKGSLSQNCWKVFLILFVGKASKPSKIDTEIKAKFLSRKKYKIGTRFSLKKLHFPLMWNNKGPGRYRANWRHGSFKYVAYVWLFIQGDWYLTRIIENIIVLI